MNKGGKENILEAARAVIARCGVANAGVQAIADEAGVSKGALYYHYKGKEYILFDLADQFLRETVAPVKQSLNGDGEKEKLLQATINGVKKRLENMEHNKLQFYLLHEAVLTQEELTARISRKYKGWITTAEEVLEALYGFPPSRLRRALAATLIAAVDGQVIQLLLDESLTDVESLLEVWQLIFSKLGALHPVMEEAKITASADDN